MPKETKQGTGILNPVESLELKRRLTEAKIQQALMRSNLFPQTTRKSKKL